MLESILKQSDCSSCKLCCKFQEDELIDAPTFTIEEVIKAKSLCNQVQFHERDGINQIILLPYQDKYICPLLSPTGCLMGEERPFDCKSWPFYLMKQNNRFLIALSKECPVVARKSIIDILSCLSSEFISQCETIISRYPAMVTEYNRDMIVVKYLNA